MPKGRTLFDKYAANLLIVLGQLDVMIGDQEGPIDPPFYICPLSLATFKQESIDSDLLTKEHVPPSSLGGKPICLSHKDFNNKSTQLDNLLKLRHDEIILKTIEGKSTAYGYLHTEDNPNQGKKTKIHTYRDESGQLVLQCIMSKGLITHLFENSELLGDGARSTLNFEVLDIQTSLRLKAAYVKNAYLKAFTHFGYSFLIDEIKGPNMTLPFNKSIDQIRDSLTDLNKEVLDSIHVVENAHSWPTNHIAIVTPDKGKNRYLAVPIFLKSGQTQKAVVIFPSFGPIRSEPLPYSKSPIDLSYVECPRYLDLTADAGALWFWWHITN